MQKNTMYEKKIPTLTTPSKKNDNTNTRKMATPCGKSNNTNVRKVITPHEKSRNINATRVTSLTQEE